MISYHKVKAIKVIFSVFLFISVFISCCYQVFADNDQSERYVSVSIPVEMAVSNSTEKFIVKIEPSFEQEFQSVENDELHLKDDSKGEFLISFTVPGTYYYEIYQLRGNNSDTIYDDTHYQAEVFVTEDDSGKMFARPFIYNENTDEKIESISFNNELKIQSINTGDMINIISYLILLIAAGSISAFLIIRRLKGERQKHK